MSANSDRPSESPEAPARAARAAAAVAIGLAAGGIALWVRLSGHFWFSDFDQIWLAARAIVAHRDPYRAVSTQFHWPFFYPLTAGIVGLPFAPFSMEWAAPVWVAVSFFLLSYALSSRSWWSLLPLASYPALNAVQAGQWSPVLSAMALMPSLGWLAVAKPTTGGAIVAAYAPATLRRANVVVALVILAASFAAWPAWPAQWLRTVSTAHHFVPLILRPGGVLLLSALVRWRRPEARLLAFLSVVPITMGAYEALPLIVVPYSRREILAFCGLTTLAYYGAARIPGSATFLSGLSAASAVFMASLYLPVLIMVLRRPNQGPVPLWLESTSRLFPSWLRGSAEGEPARE